MQESNQSQSVSHSLSQSVNQSVNTSFVSVACLAARPFRIVSSVMLCFVKRPGFEQ